MSCPPHDYMVLFRDEDTPSNLNLSQWVKRPCTCLFCGPDQQRMQYCVSCGHAYAALVWTHPERSE